MVEYRSSERSKSDGFEEAEGVDSCRNARDDRGGSSASTAV